MSVQKPNPETYQAKGHEGQSCCDDANEGQNGTNFCLPEGVIRERRQKTAISRSAEQMLMQTTSGLG